MDWDKINKLEEAVRQASLINRPNYMDDHLRLMERIQTYQNPQSIIYQREKQINDLIHRSAGIDRVLPDFQNQSQLLAEKMALGLTVTNRFRNTLESLHERYRFPQELIQPNINNIQEKLLSAAGFWTDYEKSIRRQREFLEKTLNPAADITRQLIQESSLWEKKVSALGRLPDDLYLKKSLVDASTAWQVNIESLTQRFTQDPLLQIQRSFTENIFEPGLAYSRFARRTINRIETSEDSLKTVAYSGSLNLAEEEINSAALLVRDIEPQPAEADEKPESLIIKPKINLFVLQRRDLKKQQNVFLENEDFELTDLSLAAQVAQKALNCTQLVIYCNQAGNLLGFGDIFKPTTKFTESCVYLPFVVAESKDELAVVVDYLYFIVYEGAGKDNLRFVTNGFFTRDEIDAVMAIKFLRNKWLRHDPDHGKETDIRKTWNSLGEALADLDFHYLPKTREDFTRLQLNLLTKIEEFLEQLIERMNKISANEH